MQKEIKVLFTGAHHNSALATLDWLSENGVNSERKIEFAWVGKKYISGTDKTILTPEYLEVSKRNVGFYVINPGKLYRFRSLKYLPMFIYNLALVPVGFAQAFIILLRTEPSVIVSFGGYMAVPVVIAGWLLGIPSVTHEQTTVIGLANRLIEKFVSKIYTAWPVKYYHGIKLSKLHYVGLPLRRNLLNTDSLPVIYKFSNEKPVIYVTGGKAGSYCINKLVFEGLKQLAGIANLIWSCGHRTDDINLASIQKRISELNLTENVVVKEYFDENEIGSVFKSADVVISRSGAHTVYELALLKKPSILIPISWASNNEQYYNAKVLEECGGAVVLNEDNVTSDKLFLEVNNMLEKLKSNKIEFNIKIETNGEKLLGQEIIRIIENNKEAKSAKAASEI